MSKQLTLKELNKNFEDFKKIVLDKFEKYFKVSSPKETESEPAPNLSSYTEVGTEVAIEELGSIRLLDLNYNGTGKKIWQFTKVYRPGEIGLGLPNDDNKNGFPKCEGIAEALAEVMHKIPQWLKNQIVEIEIPCYIPNKKENFDCSCRLFLLSATEMCQNRSYLAKEGRPLEYYIKNTPGWERWHWLRSPYLLGSGIWGSCGYDGFVYYSGTGDNDGVAPAFCTN